MPTISDLTLNYELPRNTTKAEYREVMHWLRDCKRIINESIELNYCEMILCNGRIS